MTDIVVPGAVLPFTYTRIWNSRSRGWKNNWSWAIRKLSVTEVANCDPVNRNCFFYGYSISFPDGREIQFNKPTNAAEGEPGNYPATPGVLERFVILADGAHAQLTLVDGTKVNWSISCATFCGFSLASVVDPYLRAVTFTYDATGTTIKEPGGRWIKIGGAGAVTTSLGQKVTYTSQYDVSGYYPWQPQYVPNPPPGYVPPDPNGSSIRTAAGTVTYNDVIDPATGQPVQAEYVYKQVQQPKTSNSPSVSQPYPFYRLIWASDPMFDGPLQQVKYIYVDKYWDSNGDAELTAVLEERWATDYTSDGVLISRVELLPNTFDWKGYSEGYYTRKETRGDGSRRSFSYYNPTIVRSVYNTATNSIQQVIGGGQNLLDHVTDYTYNSDVIEKRAYDWTRYFQTPTKITDFRNHGTTQTLEPVLGNVTRQTHPDNSYRSWTYTDPAKPYYVWTERDELGRTTTYTRDPTTHPVERIDHPGGTYETFTYNGFGQVLDHQLPSGTVVMHGYDGRALLLWEYNSVDGWPARKAYTYDSRDRVLTMQDGRARAAGAAYTTKTLYNGRHQPTEIHYPSTGLSPDPKVIYGYDKWGHRTSVTDELGHSTTTVYDAYGRPFSVTEALNCWNWNGTGLVPTRTRFWSYERVRNGITYLAATHVSKQWHSQTEPPFDAAGDRRVTIREYDENDRLSSEQTGWVQRPDGTRYQSTDYESHSYTYDDDGNKESYKDPLGRLTTYENDNRERLTKTIEPLNRITEIDYDAVGNKTLVKFPDLKTNQWLDFDGFGQAWRFIDERGNTTNFAYRWGPMKLLWGVTAHRTKDDGGVEDQVTSFGHDLMGRFIRTSFPDASFEQTTYEYGQVKSWRTRRGQTKTISYDARGREESNSWANDAAPGVDRVWDDAGRITKISNKWSTIDYAYDWAGQVVTERNTIAGSPATTQLDFHRYPDGQPAHILYPNGFRLRRDYTARGQLQTTGTDNAAGGWSFKLGSYVYLDDGNVYTRTGLDGVVTGFLYDGRGKNRVTHTYRLSPFQRYSYRTYTRDTRDRIYAWVKTNAPSANPLRERAR